jgi:ABC-type multidrug transport system ATPase subunit
LLDRLLLLNNGQTVYQGSAKDLVPYLRGLNMLIPKFSNPCDFFMNELRAQHTQLINENYQILQAEQSNKELMQTEQKTGFVARDLINNFSYEFRTLSRRHITNYFRNP